jgi:hypothetical protein
MMNNVSSSLIEIMTEDKVEKYDLIEGKISAKLLRTIPKAKPRNL